MDTINGFPVETIRKICKQSYKLRALRMTLDDVREKAEGNHCQAWIYKAAVGEMASQVERAAADLKEMVGRLELESVGRDPDAFPGFVENRS